uniref:Phosphohydrolase n=1 Tax=uncultured marine virus TaxID=186617 RepID=A0A0F7LB35_9VIRU|nr:hypothetical protein [uncultured marine virus]
MRHHVVTFTGESFDPFDPDPEKIHIIDIAHQLAGTVRWHGATNWTKDRPAITVAEHSVRVAAECPHGCVLEGLLHDAAEAYLGDMPRPYRWRFPLFIAAEERLRRVIATRFDAALLIPQAVQRADDRMCVTEFRDLVDAHSADWIEGLPDAEPFPELITPVTPFEAEVAFLAKFDSLRCR